MAASVVRLSYTPTGGYFVQSIHSRRVRLVLRGQSIDYKDFNCKVLLQIELRAVARGSRGDLEERLFRGHNTILRD
jgi:hypothetical protein